VEIVHEAGQPGEPVQAVPRGHHLLERNVQLADEPETSLPIDAFAKLLLASPDARVVGPAVPDYRAALESLGVPSSQLLAAPHVPAAIGLARLATMPAVYDAHKTFTLEPHYIRGSGAEENPKFPPLPGVESKARMLNPKES
jgi:tRNA threonylcarbamoyladenosine biosynthesis protein TsaB